MAHPYFQGNTAYPLIVSSQAGHNSEWNKWYKSYPILPYIQRHTVLVVPFMGFQYNKEQEQLTLCMLSIFSCCFGCLLIFFEINVQKIIPWILSVKQFGLRSGPTFCWAWFGSELFSKVIWPAQDTCRQKVKPLGMLKGLRTSPTMIKPIKESSYMSKHTKGW